MQTRIAPRSGPPSVYGLPTGRHSGVFRRGSEQASLVLIVGNEPIVRLIRRRHGPGMGSKRWRRTAPSGRVSALGRAPDCPHGVPGILPGDRSRRLAGPGRHLPPGRSTEPPGQHRRAPERGRNRTVPTDPGLTQVRKRQVGRDLGQAIPLERLGVRTIDRPARGFPSRPVALSSGPMRRPVTGSPHRTKGRSSSRRRTGADVRRSTARSRRSRRCRSRRTRRRHRHHRHRRR